MPGMMQAARGAAEPMPQGQPQMPQGQQPERGGRASGMMQPPQEARQQGGMENATPEEQDMYDRATALALMALYDEGMLQEVAQTVSEDEAPAEAMGEIAASLTLRVYKEAEDQGVQLSGEVLMHSGAEIVEHIADIAKRVGVPVDEAMMEQAYYHGLDMFRSLAQQSGIYDEAAAQEDVAMLNQMDQDGRLEQMLAGQGAG